MSDLTTLSFEEYEKMKAPAVDAVVNDFAANIYKKAKEDGNPLTYEECVEIAKRDLPELFVPEWMKNLRVVANECATRISYLHEILSGLNDLKELVSVVHEKEIEAWVEENVNNFKRMTEEAEE